MIYGIGTGFRAHVAISDEAEYALAFVTLEQVSP